MQQYAPDPLDLFELVARAEYRPGWSFWIGDTERDPASSHGEPSGGLTLEITTWTIDTHNHDQKDYRVRHIFPVPPATYNRESWTAWLFDRICDVERHEAAEFFAICRNEAHAKRDGERDVDFPFQPVHAPHWDPYMLTVTDTSAMARSTRYDGTVAA